MKRFKANEVDSERYYMMPKELFINPKYNKLTSDAKILYSVLRDRMELSKKNDWINEVGEIYLIYTREDLVDLIGVKINP